MPGEAVSLGAAQYVLPLENVAQKILSLADAMDITRDAREA
jgi:chemotaxis response regulator CheB